MLESPFATGSRIRPSFCLWNNMNENQRRTWLRKCNGGLVDLDEGLLLPLITFTEVLYPADHSLVYVQQGGAPGNQIKVIKDNYQFGILPISRSTHNFIASGCVNIDKKKNPQQMKSKDLKSKDNKTKIVAKPIYTGHFVASFGDNTRVVVHEGDLSMLKPDGFSTVQVSVTSTSGLVVTANSDGTVTQQLQSGRGLIDASEASRYFKYDGTIIRKMYDGSVEVFFPNGESGYKSAPNNVTDGDNIDNNNNPQTDEELAEGTWIFTDNSGFRCKLTPEGKQMELLPPINVKKQLDPETEAIVSTREDFSGNLIVIDYKDGTKVISMEDGTLISSTPSGEKVIITCIGFATIEIDTAFSAMATSHSLGQRIALSQGGNFTRSKICMPDGTVTEIQYDTRYERAKCKIIHSICLHHKLFHLDCTLFPFL